MNLMTGQKLTIFSISEWMAHTLRREIQIVRVDVPTFRPDYVNASRGATRLAVYKERGKRKDYYLDLRPDALVFDGWDLPIKADSEVADPAGGKMFSGNACFNLAGDPAVIREFLENRNLNGPTSDDTRAKVIAVLVDARGLRNGEEVLLYPDIPTSHAAVNRRRETVKPQVPAGFVSDQAWSQ